MKRITVLALTALIATIACKKERAEPDPGPIDGKITVAIDAKHPSVTMNPPTGQFKHAQFILTGKNATLLDGTLRFSASGGLKLSSIRNVWAVIKDKDNAQLVAEPIGSIAPSERTFPIDMDYRGDEIDTLQVWYEVPSDTVRGTLDISFDGYYAPFSGVQQAHTGFVPGQRVTFANVNVSTKLSLQTPASMLVSGDQDVVTTIFTVSATGQPVISAVKVTIPNWQVVSSVDILNGAASIGTAPVAGSVTTVPVTVPMNSDSKDLKVSLNLRPVASGQSASNIRTSVSIQYKLPNGTVRSNDTLRNGNDIWVYKSVPTFTFNPLSGSIVNNVPLKVISITITAPSQGDVGFKQFGFPVVLADNGTNDTLELGTPRFELDGVSISTRSCENASGDTISKLGENDQHLFVTFTNEITIPAGTSKKIELWLTPKNFDQSEGDGFGIGFAGDAEQTAYQYVNKGTSGFHAKLAGTQSATNSAKVYNCLWSDKAHPSHTGLYGLSSPDWYNGWKLFPAMPTQVWSRGAQSEAWMNSFK